MTGIILALLGSIILAFADACKKKLTDQFPIELIIVNTAAWSVPLVALVVLATTGVPAVDWGTTLLWLPLAIALFILNEVLFTNSFAYGEFSEVVPFKAAGPVFALLLSLAYGELPSAMALAGIGAIIVGVYLLYLPSFSAEHLLTPLKSCLKGRGPQMMIYSQIALVACATPLRNGGAASTPLFFFLLVLCGYLAVMVGVVLKKRLSPVLLYRDTVYQNTAALAAGNGILWTAGLTLFSVSFSYTAVVNAQAVGQIYPIASMAVAYFILKERAALSRALPCLCMIGGVLLVLFGQG